VKPMRRCAAMFLGLLAACGSGPACVEGESAVVTIDGHDFLMRLADDGAERAQGLMGVTELGPDEGMAFVFEQVAEQTFWMKDTLIPLDLVALADGKVVSVDTMTPCETATCPTTRTAPAGVVVEIPGGRAAELGIEVGDPASIDASCR